MDSSRRKYFDCKHCIDAVAAGTVDDGVIESKFDFYHRFAVAAAVAHKLTASRRIDLIDSIRDVDRLARCVLDRNHSVVVAVAVGPAVGSEIYSA